MKRPLMSFLVGGCFLFTLAMGAGAHELFVPGDVYAEDDGSFQYTVILEQTTAIEYGGLEIDGRDNTDVGWMHADGFCMVVRPPGTYTWPVSGRLLSLSQNGSVHYREYLCDGWQGEGTTRIIRSAVGSEAFSFSAIKGLFR